MSYFLITRICQDRKYIVKFTSKTRFKEFFQPRAICSQNRKDSKLCSCHSHEKSRVHSRYIAQLLFIRTFSPNHVFNTKGNIEKFNLVENLQNTQKCRPLVQKANTCSETRIPMLFLYRSKYSHRKSQHNSVKFLNRFHSFDITKKAIFHLFL